MAFASFDDKRGGAPVAEINMVPLIDVMLVLLVIFIVAAPLLTQSVKLDLPKASAQPTQPQPDAIQLSLNAEGVLFWNGKALSRKKPLLDLRWKGPSPLRRRCVSALIRPSPTVAWPRSWPMPRAWA